MTTYVDEVRAYLSGFGDPPRLYDALRDATLAVPLDHHGRLFTLVEAGIPWMLAFTTPERLREFAELTDRDLDEVRYLDNPFATTDLGDFDATDVRGDWAKQWAKGKQPF